MGPFILDNSIHNPRFTSLFLSLDFSQGRHQISSFLYHSLEALKGFSYISFSNYTLSSNSQLRKEFYQNVWTLIPENDPNFTYELLWWIPGVEDRSEKTKKFTRSNWSSKRPHGVIAWKFHYENHLLRLCRKISSPMKSSSLRKSQIFFINLNYWNCVYTSIFVSIIFSLICVCMAVRFNHFFQDFSEAIIYVMFNLIKLLVFNLEATIRGLKW